ncbi:MULTISPECIES: hypothetical protein [unclassified Ruegeria]|uniref:hypothetical protein n=1 Tax=unclassified Ruegeria TaxID=2625375 RepID=UPI0014877D3D|nr:MULTISPECIES: hypothetical protein [unclassified Ruegeria]
MGDFLGTSGKSGRLFMLRLIGSKSIQVDQMADKGSGAHLKQAISDCIIHQHEKSDLSAFYAMLKLPETPRGL